MLEGSSCLVVQCNLQYVVFLCNINGGVFAVDIAISGGSVLTFKGRFSSGYYNNNSIDLLGPFSSANCTSTVSEAAIAAFKFTAGTLTDMLILD